MNRFSYIGICGYANSGKDFLCEVLGNEYNVYKRSLADSLKREVRDYCIIKYGIDPTCCSRAEKEVIRPFLVEYGLLKRSQNECYFTTALDNYLSESKNLPYFDFLIVPDIRYSNEVNWLKRKNGILISVTRNGISAPNEEERLNLPLVEKKADFSITWPEFKENKFEKALDFLDSQNIIQALNGRLRTCRKSKNLRGRVCAT